MHEADCPPECPCSGGRGEECPPGQGREARSAPPQDAQLLTAFHGGRATLRERLVITGSPARLAVLAASVLGGVSSTSANSGPGGKLLRGQGRCSVSDSLLLKVLASIRLAARRLQGPELGKK